MAAIVFSLDDGNNREMFREHGAMILDSALSSGSRVIVVHDDDDSSGQTHVRSNPPFRVSQMMPEC